MQRKQIKEDDRPTSASAEVTAQRDKSARADVDRPASNPGNDVQLAEYESRLYIDKHGLDQELMSQPQFYAGVGECYAVAVSRRDLAETELKELEADLQSVIREDCEAKDRKYTEASVKADVISHSSRKNAARKLIDCEREVNRWEALREACKQRGFFLRDLVNLHLGAYYAANDARGGQQQGAARAHDYEVRRGQVADQRPKYDLPERKRS
jgi:hypothetical protein